MISKTDLYAWCSIPADQLVSHPRRKMPFRMCADSTEMGEIMARELVEEIESHNAKGEPTRAIIPCGPSCWYQPFTVLVNRRGVELSHFIVFHMDECLDWQGQLLPRGHPYSFRGFMEQHFYNPVRAELAVRPENRYWLEPDTIESVREAISSAPVDLCYGGWGQDGHVAYNQARRHPYLPISVEDLRSSTIRIQENNWDTIIALANRTFGSAYQFVPSMSVTLGIKEVLSAKKIRLFSDTGAWKQTALRVALFSPIDPEYPITILQEHPDVLLTATRATAGHPISEHPEWDLGLPNQKAGQL
jgi:glucosamine-6-phosphate deaminase